MREKLAFWFEYVKFLVILKTTKKKKKKRVVLTPEQDK